MTAPVTTPSGDAGTKWLAGAVVEARTHRVWRHKWRGSYSPVLYGSYGRGLLDEQISGREQRQALSAVGGDRTIDAAGQETLQQLTAPAR